MPDRHGIRVASNFAPGRFWMTFWGRRTWGSGCKAWDSMKGKKHEQVIQGLLEEIISEPKVL